MKKVEMEKVLRGADVSGTACQFVARGRTMDDILARERASTRWPTTGSR